MSGGRSASRTGSRPKDRAAESVSPVPASIPSVDEWEERIDLAIKAGTTPAKDGAHNYIHNGMRCLLGSLRVSIGLLRLEQFARDQRLDQEALDAIHALTDKARGQ